MRSIKPGRGPSMHGGIVGIFMICFGIGWTLLAAQASGFMALFGVLWTGIAVVTTVYNFKNATGKNRYSAFDITEAGEEPDPLNTRFGAPTDTAAPSADADRSFCPYCGKRVEKDFTYCQSCGRKLK